MVATIEKMPRSVRNNFYKEIMCQKYRLSRILLFKN